MIPARVVEIVPARVVEMVPALVVEMVPVFASAGAEIARTNMAVQMAALRFFMGFAPVVRTSDQWST